MSEEAKAKLAKAREVVAANRAAKKAELEAAKEIVRAKAAKPAVEEAPAPVKTKSTKKVRRHTHITIGNCRVFAYNFVNNGV